MAYSINSGDSWLGSAITFGLGGLALFGLFFLVSAIRSIKEGINEDQPHLPSNDDPEDLV